MSQFETDLERWQATMEAFYAFALAQPAEAEPARAAADQAWGLREVLAHLVYHHEGYVAQARAWLAGQAFVPPQGKFNDLNAQAVAAHAGVPLSQLVRRLRAADSQLRQIALQPGGAQLTIQIKQGSKCWPLPELICAVEAHVRRHHQQLKRSAIQSQ